MRQPPHTREHLVIGQLGPVEQRRWSLDEVLRRNHTRQLELFRRPGLLPAVEHLPQLERLDLWGMTVTDAGPVTRARKLKRLTIALGATRDISFVREMSALEELWLVQIRGLESLAGVTGPATLRVLWLENLPRVDRLPGLSGFPNLHRVELINLPKLSCLAPLLDAPALRQLKIGLRQASPEMLAPLKNHQSLRSSLVATGRSERDQHLNSLLASAEPWKPDFALLPETPDQQR